MNAPEKIALPDIQAQADTRQLAIDHVGIKGVRYPINIVSAGVTTPTVAVIAMSVGLAAVVKGTHMSRFLEILEENGADLDQANFMDMARRMLVRLEAQSGEIEMRFPYFVKKLAPVSGVASLLDVEVSWKASVLALGRCHFSMRVSVAATSLCPCSKEISAYGAHNQRSMINIEVALAQLVSIEDIVTLAERCASCEVYGLLKRVDEKYVTERAYDNPKFVEDIVRDVALALADVDAVSGYTVDVENFESIHNHSAFARISRCPL